MVSRTGSRRIAGAGGVDLAVHHLGGSGAPVMLVHATGFHGRCWEPVARVLAPSYDVWALDVRGHGASGPAPEPRNVDWSVFAEDVISVVGRLGADGDVDASGGWRAAGHSMGGAVILMAEAMSPGLFRAMCCYEPVVFPPGTVLGAPGRPGGTVEPTGAPGEGSRPRVHLAELARKRRETFPSRDAAFENFRSKPPFSRFDTEALRSYVTYGFVDLPDGTVALACARDYEAEVFEGSLRTGAWDALPGVRSPVAVLSGADPIDPLGSVAPLVARRLPRGGFRRLGHLDHFGPMTSPTEIGDLMAVALGVADRGGTSTMAVTPSA